MSELDARKQLILRAIVLEYVAGAEPIGSELIAGKYELGVRSATIRNEMADLSEMGLLEQPHTSAGRIPSDQGYRFYVDHLIEPKSPGIAAKGQLKDSLEDGDALQGVLRETTKVLSRLTQLLSAATTVNDSHVQVRHAVITALGPERALLVLVLSNGHVENRVVECPAGLTLEDLGRANEWLTQLLGGKSLQQVSRLKNEAQGSPAQEKLMTRVLGAARGAARDLTRGVVITEGEEYLVAQPEFRREPMLMDRLIDALEREDTLHNALAAQGSGHSTQITIGRENHPESLQAFTVVRRTFRIGDDEAGAIALIGPTRLDYDSAVSLLDFTAHAIGQTLTKLLGR